jgi:hypothetical protein
MSSDCVIRVAAVSTYSGASYQRLLGTYLGLAEGGEMGLLTCSECGDDVSGTAATARPKHSRKVHPVTWIVAAALIPILVWDVRQTLRESKSHGTSSEASRLHPDTRQ